ncbi:hypothetical protein Trydic_g17670 [Trypoxylus dichotomus]
MMVAMDESSWKVLRDIYHGRLHLQFSSVSFGLLSRNEKERAETEGQIYTTETGPFNLSIPEPNWSDGTRSAVGSPQSTGNGPPGISNCGPPTYSIKREE